MEVCSFLADEDEILWFLGSRMFHSEDRRRSDVKRSVVAPEILLADLKNDVFRRLKKDFDGHAPPQLVRPGRCSEVDPSKDSFECRIDFTGVGGVDAPEKSRELRPVFH